MLIWRLASSMVILLATVVAERNISGPGQSVLQQIPAVKDASIMLNGTCEEWTAWPPPRVNPAIVVQAISNDYADVERNFIALMETNSKFNRDNLYLMCLDPQSVVLFRSMDIHCVFVADIQAHQHHAIWRLRVKVVGCLLAAGFDVVTSDADALWLDDPMKDLESPANKESSIVASRGTFPFPLGREWGSTMCMGFALFRSSGKGMRMWQQVMLRIVGDTGDDQIALNKAAEELGITWDTQSDMRYTRSTGEGRGVVPNLSTANGREFVVTLLPHSRYTRMCSVTPLSHETVVAHCMARHRAGAKTSWMQESNHWLVNNSYGG